MCVRRTVMCVVFGLFLGLGVLFYTQYNGVDAMELDAIEALYFSIVTISTVGYGDYSPDNDWERLFTVFYQLVGIAMIFGVAAELYTGSTAFFLVRINKIVRWVSSKCYPISEGKHMPAWLYYATGLAGPFFFGVTFNIFFSAWIFTLTNDADTDYNDLLWHCWVTATTVGYGDVSLDTNDSRLFASFHILVSVSWLASLIGMVDELKQQRRYNTQKDAALNAQLSLELIATLDHGYGDTKKGHGVNEMEFVLGMLGVMGTQVCGEDLDFERHVLPLVQRFRQLDVDGGGQLDHEDLVFMVETCCEKAKCNNRQSQMQESETSQHDKI